MKTVILGATGDLGAATAKAFADDGHELVLHGHTRPDRLEEVAATVGASKSFLCDLTVEADVERSFRELGKFDNLVHCAAINPTVDRVADLDTATWSRTLEVNLTSAFLTVKHAMPLLRDAVAPSVVLVSSVFGLETPARRAAYGASKHGLTALVQVLTREEGYWLRVNSVCPGPMWSDNLRGILEKHARAEDITLEEYVLRRVADIPAQRFMELHECAAVILFLCSPGASFIRGEDIRVTGGAIV